MLKTEIRPAPVAPGNVIFQAFPDGSLRVRNTTPLGPYPRSLTERLEHWAAVVPDRLFLAERDGDGWRNVTYRDALNAARAIGQSGPARSRSLRHAARPHRFATCARSRRCSTRVCREVTRRCFPGCAAIARCGKLSSAAFGSCNIPAPASPSISATLSTSLHARRLANRFRG